MKCSLFSPNEWAIGCKWKDAIPNTPCLMTGQMLGEKNRERAVEKKIIKILLTTKFRGLLLGKTGCLIREGSTREADVVGANKVNQWGIVNLGFPHLGFCKQRCRAKHVLSNLRPDLGWPSSQKMSCSKHSPSTHHVC